jgi:hypothetical protein
MKGILIFNMISTFGLHISHPAVSQFFFASANAAAFFASSSAFNLSFTSLSALSADSDFRGSIFFCHSGATVSDHIF